MEWWGEGESVSFYILANSPKLFTKANVEFAPRCPEGPAKGCMGSLSVYQSVLSRHLQCLDFIIYPFNTLGEPARIRHCPSCWGINEIWLLCLRISP